MQELLSHYYKVEGNYYIKLDDLENLGLVIIENGIIIHKNGLASNLIRFDSLEIKDNSEYNELLENLKSKQEFIHFFNINNLFKSYILKKLEVNTKNIEIWIIIPPDNNLTFPDLIKRETLLDKILLDVMHLIISVEKYEELTNLVDTHIKQVLHILDMKNIINFKVEGSRFYAHHSHEKDKIFDKNHLAEFTGELDDMCSNILIEKFQNKEVLILHEHICEDSKLLIFSKQHGFDIIIPIVNNNSVGGFNTMTFNDFSLISNKILTHLFMFTNLTLFLRNKENLIRNVEKKDVLYKTLLDLSEDAIALHSNGIVEYVNKAAIRQFKAIDESELVGINVMSLVHPDSKDLITTRIEKMAKGEEVESWVREKMLALDNSVLDVRTSSRSVVLDGVTHIMSVLRNISHEVNLEKEIYLTEQKYRTLIENSPDPIIILKNNIIVFSNPKSVELFKEERVSEIVGRSIRDFLVPAKKEKILAWLSTAPPQEKYNIIYPLQGVDKLGNKKDLEVTMTSIFYDDGPADLVFIRDRTLYVSASKSLEESEKKYRSLFENSTDAIYISEVNGKIIEVNESFLKMFGYTRDELFYIKSSDFYHDNKDREDLLSILEDEGFVSGYETNLVKKDGTVLICKLTTQVNRDSEDNIIYYQGLIRDVTEERKIEQAMLVSQKLESLGILAGGIAHDFNNLLMGILSSSSLALKLEPEESEIIPLLKMIDNTSQKAAKLVNQLLAYAGEVKIQKEETNLTLIIQEMGQLIALSVPKKTVLTYVMKDRNAIVEVDKVQLEQVILNLIRNSADALEDINRENGLISIETELVNIDIEKILNLISMENIPSGLYSKMKISDNGRGIDPETFGQIFDPFYTTKFAGRGLGLAAVMGIVKAHNGAIEIESELGSGTSFSIYFPILRIDKDFTFEEIKHDTLPIDDIKEVKLSGRVNVLIIDDEDIVRQVVSRLLIAIGYNPIAVDSGEKGLDILQANIKLDLILLDLTMPGMDGRETYEQIMKIRDDIPIIISSGYSERESMNLFKNKKIGGFLHKPYILDDLKEIINKVLTKS